MKLRSEIVFKLDDSDFDSDISLIVKSTHI